MKLIDFDIDAGLLHQFLNLSRELYARDPNWSPDAAGERLLGAGGSSTALWRNFLVVDGDHLLGRVTALMNPLLLDERGCPFGQLGFFECVDDFKAARLLIDGAVDWLRVTLPDSQTVLAPMNFDTWHSYRLRTRGFDQPAFLMEPYNPPSYPGLFTALGFAPISHYVTKTVTRLSAMINAWEPYYQDAIARGYRFRSFDRADVPNEMSLVYRLSISAFRENPFFVDVSLAEFRSLYAGAAGSLDPDLLVFAIDPAGECVGFSFSLTDHRLPGTVNVKTFGTVPRVQRSGVGAALAREIYCRFQAKGFTTVNHCLMRVGNRADQFDRGMAKITREYTLYSRSLRT